MLSHAALRYNAIVKKSGREARLFLLLKRRGPSLLPAYAGRFETNDLEGNNEDGGGAVLFIYEMSNPRSQNGALRQKHRARFKAMAAPCGICRGKLGPIHYDEPSDAMHPLSFVIDEVRPISRYKQFGYETPAAAAQDWNNLQAAHYCCNAAKGNKTEPTERVIRRVLLSDGSW